MTDGPGLTPGRKQCAEPASRSVLCPSTSGFSAFSPARLLRRPLPSRSSLTALTHDPDGHGASVLTLPLPASPTASHPRSAPSTPLHSNSLRLESFLLARLLRHLSYPKSLCFQKVCRHQLRTVSPRQLPALPLRLFRPQRLPPDRVLRQGPSAPGSPAYTPVLRFFPQHASLGQTNGYLPVWILRWRSRSFMPWTVLKWQPRKEKQVSLTEPHRGSQEESEIRRGACDGAGCRAGHPAS